MKIALGVRRKTRLDVHHQAVDCPVCAAFRSMEVDGSEPFGLFGELNKAADVFCLLKLDVLATS